MYENKLYQLYIVIKYNCYKILWRFKKLYRRFFPDKRRSFYGWTEISIEISDPKATAIGVISNLL